MKLNKIIFATFLFISEFAFSQVKKSFILRKDSLFVNNNNCAKLMDDNFYKYKKLYISTKYRIIDFIEISSQKNLKVLILSPINQEGDSYRFPCNLVVKRILLIYNKNVNHDFVKYVTDELILNQYNFPSDPYLYQESLKSLNKGFSLYFSAGSKVKCDLTLFFTNKKGDFYLYKYTANYYSTGLPHSKNRTFLFKINKGNELVQIKTLNLMKFPNW